MPRGLIPPNRLYQEATKPPEPVALQGEASRQRQLREAFAQRLEGAIDAAYPKKMGILRNAAERLQQSAFGTVSSIGGLANITSEGLGDPLIAYGEAGARRHPGSPELVGRSLLEEPSLALNPKYVTGLMADFLPSIALSAATGAGGAMLAGRGAQALGLTEKAIGLARTLGGGVGGGIAGGGLEAGSFRNQAIEGGATPEEANRLATTAGLISSITNAIPEMKAFAPNATASLMRRMVQAAGLESVTEASDPLVQNQLARATFDPTLSPWEGVPEAALGAFGVGGVTGAAGHAVESRFPPPPPTSNNVSLADLLRNTSVPTTEAGIPRGGPRIGGDIPVGLTPSPIPEGPQVIPQQPPAPAPIPPNVAPPNPLVPGPRYPIQDTYPEPPVRPPPEEPPPPPSPPPPPPVIPPLEVPPELQQPTAPPEPGAGAPGPEPPNAPPSDTGGPPLVPTEPTPAPPTEADLRRERLRRVLEGGLLGQPQEEPTNAIGERSPTPPNGGVVQGEQQPSAEGGGLRVPPRGQGPTLQGEGPQQTGEAAPSEAPAPQEVSPPRPEEAAAPKEGQAGIEAPEGAAPAPTGEAAPSEKHTRLRTLADSFTEKMPSDVRGLHQQAAEALGKSSWALAQAENPELRKETEEAVELAVARNARKTIGQGNREQRSIAENPSGETGMDQRRRAASDEATLQILVRDYESQPNLGTRTAASSQNQAYSTPSPLGFILQRAAGVTDQTTVYEPTAGTGLLLTAANPEKTQANELNDRRVAVLQDQGFNPTQEDATTYQPTEPVDVVVANPPFGSQRGTVKGPVDGKDWRVDGLAHLIIGRALEALKPGGRAAFIIGGHTEFDADGFPKGRDRHFLTYLYDNFAVDAHINVDGKLYQKQGTKYPVRVFVVQKGAKPSGWRAIKGSVTSADTFEAVYEQATKNRTAAATEGQAGGVGGLEGAGGKGITETPQPGPVQKPPGGRGGEPSGAGARGPAGPNATEGQAGGVGGVRGPSERGGKPGRGGGETGGAPTGVTPGETRGEQRPGGPEPTERPRTPLGEKAAEKRADLKKSIDRLGGLLNNRFSSNPFADPEVLAAVGDIILDAIEAGVYSFADVANQMYEAFRNAYGAERAREFMDAAGQHIEEGWRRMAAIDDRLDQPVNTQVALEGGASKASALGDLQVPYEPTSKGTPMDTLSPSGLRAAMSEARVELEKRVGNLDDYVREKLGLHDSNDEMWERLGAEQVDGIAAAIEAVDNGDGFINGDQTGIGKGRQAAAMIWYAMRRGYTPVFMTAKPHLFSAMWEDLRDIGVDTKKVRPLIINKKNADVREKHKDVLGREKVRTVHRPVTGKAREQALNAIEQGRLPEGYDVAFVTYSQISGSKATAPKILGLVSNSNTVMVMDESHKASGSESTVGVEMSNAIKGSKAVVHLSATYSKRPDNFGIYHRTLLGRSGMSVEEIVDVMRNGGKVMQTIVSNALAKAGHMIRRERSFAGIDYLTTPEDEALKTYKDDAELSDAVTDGLRYITRIEQQAAFKKGLRAFTKAMQEQFGPVRVNGKNVYAKVKHNSYFSVVHNQVKAALTGIKVQRAIEAAKDSLENGEQVVIVLERTNGSALQQAVDDRAMKLGDDIDSFTYAHLIDNAVEGVFWVRVEPPGSSESIRMRIPDEFFSTAFLNEIAEFKQSNHDNPLITSVPGSPIDAIRRGLSDAGYTTDEITGRTMYADEENGWQLARRPAFDRQQVVDSFNRGTTRVLILNAAGAEGISLHASVKNPLGLGQAPRRMIILEPHQDIEVFMQLLGRVNRTGMVELENGKKPVSFLQLTTRLPGEHRPSVVLSQKLASMSANTTGKQESEVGRRQPFPDMDNHHGDVVTGEVLEDLGREFQDLLGLSFPTPAFKEVSGRAALAPVELQEEFFEALRLAYNAKIDALNAAGENDLVVTDRQWDATPVGEPQEIFGGSDESNPLTASAYLQQWSILDDRKPLTKEELEEEITRKSDGKSPDEHRTQLITELRERAKEYIEGQEKLASDWEEAHRAENDERRAQGLEPRENPRRRLAVAAALRAQETLRQLASYRIGDSYRVQINDRQGNALETVPGVVVGIRTPSAKTKGNPATPGKIVIEFALASNARRLPIPLTKIGEQVHGPITYKDYRAGWDQEIARAGLKSRRDVWMVTGNLFAGINAIQERGTIYSFEARGQKDPLLGYRLPENYDPGASDSNVLLPDRAADVVTSAWEATQLQRGLVASYRGDDVLVVYLDNDRFLIHARSDKAGNRFRDNEEITNHLDGGKDGFIKRKIEGKDRWAGNFTIERLRPILKAIGGSLRVPKAIINAVEKGSDKPPPPSGGGGGVTLQSGITPQNFIDFANALGRGARAIAHGLEAAIPTMTRGGVTGAVSEARRYVGPGGVWSRWLRENNWSVQRMDPRVRQIFREMDNNLQRLGNEAVKQAQKWLEEGVTGDQAAILSNVVERLVAGEFGYDAADATEQVKRAAAWISQHNDNIRTQLEELGMLSEEGREALLGSYLMREYAPRGLRHPRQAWGEFLRTIRGKELKPRGKVLNVAAKVARTVKVAADVGDPNKALALAKNEVIVGEKSYRDGDEVGTEYTVGEIAAEAIPDPFYKPYTVGPQQAYEGLSVRSVHKLGEVRAARQGTEAGTYMVTIWRDFTTGEREAMGERRDGVYRWVVGELAAQHDIALGEAFKRILEDMPEDVNGTKDPGLAGWKQIPSGKVPKTRAAKFGVLAGRYVSPEVYDAVMKRAGGRRFLDHPGVRQWRRIQGVWKGNKTALSPVVHSNNVFTSHVMLYLLSGISPGEWRRGGIYREMLRDFRRKGPRYQFWLEHGLFGHDFLTAEGRPGSRMRELRNMFPQYYRMGEEQAGDDETAYAQLWSGALKLSGRLWEKGGGKKYVEAMTDVYRAEDAFFKMVAAEHAYRYGINPKKSATGKILNPRPVSVQDAIDRANESIFDYTDMPGWAEGVRDFVIPFFSYTLKASHALAVTAAEHPERIAKVSALIWSASLLSAAAQGDLPDLEKEEEVLPAWMKGLPTAFLTPRHVRLGRSGETSWYMDLSRRLPLGDVFDTAGLGFAWWPAALTPNNPLLGAFVAMFYNKDGFTGRAIYNDTDTVEERSIERAAWLYRHLMPNTPILPGSYAFLKMAEAYAQSTGTEVDIPGLHVTGQGFRGEDRKGLLLATADVLGGFKIRGIVPKQEAQSRRREFRREIRGLKKDIGNIRRNQSLPKAEKEKAIQRKRATIDEIRREIGAVPSFAR